MPANTNTKNALKISTLALVSALAFAPVAAHADNDLRDVVHDQRGNVVVITNGNCVRTKWVGAADECGAAPVVAVVKRERAVIAQDERTVYFEFDKATLTPESRIRLDSLAAKIKREEDVKEARIAGYADRLGSTSYNDRLSQRRARAVSDYLTEKGVINTRVTETRWLGESAPITKCAEGLARAEKIACLQKDRRVEVEIDYKPEMAR